MNAGRCGTTASSSSRVGRPPGNGTYIQPRPWTQASFGFAAACAAMASWMASTVGQLEEVDVVELLGTAEDVDVGVVEARGDQAATGLDDPRPRTLPVAATLVHPADPRDLPAADRHRVRRGDRSWPDVRPVRRELARAVRLEDAPVDDEEVGGAGGGVGRRRELGSLMPSARLEAGLHRRPLGGDDAEPRGVAQRPVGHDHVVAEDALEGGADPGEGVARPVVSGVGLELDPIRLERLERVGQLEQLRLAVDPAALVRRRRSTSSRSRGACARARSTCSGCCRSPGRWRGRWSRTAARCRPPGWPAPCRPSGAGPARPARP